LAKSHRISCRMSPENTLHSWRRRCLLWRMSRSLPGLLGSCPGVASCMAIIAFFTANCRRSTSCWIGPCCGPITRRMYFVGDQFINTAPRTAFPGPIHTQLSEAELSGYL
jgi:hypothetical protein